MVVVLTAFYQLLTFFSRDYESQLAIAETHQQSHVALSLFRNEVQNTGLSTTTATFLGPQTNGRVPVACQRGQRNAEPIMEVSETVFHFMVDVDSSGTFNKNNDNNEDVRYEWVGKSGRALCDKQNNTRGPNTLYRDTGGGLQEVASGITNFKLRYFDEGDVLIPENALMDKRNQIQKIVLTIKSSSGQNLNRKDSEWNTEIYLKNIG